MLPASYATVADVLGRYPMIGSVSAVTSAHICDAIAAEQSLIDTKLGTRYVVPFIPTPPIVATICADLATMRVISSRLIMPNDPKGGGERDTMLSVFKQSRTVLDSLTTGLIRLVSGSGTLFEPIAQDVGEVLTNVSAINTPTFVGQDWFDAYDLASGGRRF